MKTLLDSLNHRRTQTIEEVDTPGNYKKRENPIKNTVKKQYCNSKSVGKVKSIRSSPQKERIHKFSYGEISKLSQNA